MKTFDQIIEPLQDKIKNIDWSDLKKFRDRDLQLNQKYKDRIAKGWYGFSLGTIPSVWLEVIELVLSEIEMEVPDYQILQIKLKFGSCRCYLHYEQDNSIKFTNITKLIRDMERFLYNKALYY